MKKDYTDNRKKLAERIKNEPVQTPIQEVRPVKEVNTEKEESHVNFWLPSSLMDSIKLVSVKQRKSIKQIGKEAFELYLKSNDI